MPCLPTVAQCTCESSWIRRQGLGAPGQRRSKPGETHKPRPAPRTVGPGSTWKVQATEHAALRSPTPTRSCTAAPLYHDLGG